MSAVAIATRESIDVSSPYQAPPRPHTNLFNACQRSEMHRFAARRVCLATAWPSRRASSAAPRSVIVLSEQIQLRLALRLVAFCLGVHYAEKQPVAVRRPATRSPPRAPAAHLQTSARRVFERVRYVLLDLTTVLPLSASGNIVITSWTSWATAKRLAISKSAVEA